MASPQFVPPGRCLVLLTENADALWVSSWPQFASHAWKGAWVCTAFRNESGHLSSTLIREALSATRSHWPTVPELGMITFVNPAQVRKKRDWGRCFRRAGFVLEGTTPKGLIVLRLAPDAMPDPESALYPADSLFAFQPRTA